MFSNVVTEYGYDLAAIEQGGGKFLLVFGRHEKRESLWASGMHDVHSIGCGSALITRARMRV